MMDALHQAALAGDLSLVKQLTNVETINSLHSKEGTTPICWAAEGGHLEVLAYLVQQGADCTGSHARALYLACKYGHETVASYLIHQAGIDPGAEITLVGGKQASCALVAADFGRVEVLKVLKQASVDLNAAISSGPLLGWTPLLQACMAGHEAVVAFLIHEAGVNLSVEITLADGKQVSCALVAAEGGRVGVLKVLKQAGVDLNAPIRSGPLLGQTPFLRACVAGHEAVVAYLIQEVGVDPQVGITLPDGEYSYALVAADYGRVEVLKVLKQVEVELNSAVSSGPQLGRTPLLQACRNGHEAAVRYLIHEAGIDPQAEITLGGGKQTSCALVAADYGRVEVLKVLKQAGVDLNAAISSGPRLGQTPLLQACSIGHMAAVHYLIHEAGVDPRVEITLTGGKKTSCSLIAAASGRIEVLKVLKQAGVNLNTAISGGPLVGNTPLFQACKIGHEAVVVYLLKEGEVNPTENAPSVRPILCFVLEVIQKQKNPEFINTTYAHILQLLAQAGASRDEIDKSVNINAIEWCRKSLPQYTPYLLNDIEIELDNMLFPHKKFLASILSNSKEFPANKFLAIKHHEGYERSIPTTDIGDYMYEEILYIYDHIKTKVMKSYADELITLMNRYQKAKQFQQRSTLFAKTRKLACSEQEMNDVLAIVTNVVSLEEHAHQQDAIHPLYKNRPIAPIVIWENTESLEAEPAQADEGGVKRPVNDSFMAMFAATSSSSTGEKRQRSEAESVVKKV